MKFAYILRIAFRALLRNKMRSGLTSLGIIIGIASVIAMVSIGRGAQAQIEAEMAKLGENIMMVYPGSVQTGGVRSGLGGAVTLTEDDAAAIATELPGVVAMSPEQRTRSQLVANGANWNSPVIGGSTDYLQIRGWRMAAGTMYNDAHVHGMAKVAVIGQTVAASLFPDEDPIGRMLRIGRVPFTIIGVLAPKGFSLGGQDQDDIVLVPYTSHMRRLTRRRDLSTILVQANHRDAIPVVAERIEDLLRYRHGLLPGTEDDFRVRTQEELTQRATASTEALTSLLAGVAGLSLLVGGIGIMNIMLVSVTERTREIGIRLAIGARSADVMRQFLVEAIVTSSLGGAIGVAIGIALSKTLAAVQGWPVEISVVVGAVAVAFSACIGIFFGIYPARRAARLDPIEALRFE